MFLAVPFDQQVTDTYFVIAHFHCIIFGAAVFPIFAGMYFWFPKVTGKLYYELPGQISFWIIFVGTNLLFFPMHIVGLEGMPRRNYTYPSGLGWGSENLAETTGSYLTTVGILVLLVNLVVSWFRGPPAGPDPLHGATLEWPIVLALAMSTVFVLLLLHLWVGVCFALAGIVLALLGWHGEEPQESEA